MSVYFCAILTGIACAAEYLDACVRDYGRSLYVQYGAEGLVVDMNWKTHAVDQSSMSAEQPRPIACVAGALHRHKLRTATISLTTSISIFTSPTVCERPPLNQLRIKHDHFLSRKTHTCRLFGMMR